MADDTQTNPKTCKMRLKTHGPYGAAWPCGEPRWHLSRHRHRNYTWPRLPRVWRLVNLVRTWQANRWLRDMGASRHDGLMRYQAVLFPRRFDPLPTAQLSRRLADEARGDGRG